MIINDLYIQLHDKPQKKQEEENEQAIRSAEEIRTYNELMDAYDMV